MSEEECPICHVLLTDDEHESFSLVRWDPVTRTNNLVQMFCPEHRPLPAPDYIRREVERPYKHDTVLHVLAGGLGLYVPGCPRCDHEHQEEAVRDE